MGSNESTYETFFWDFLNMCCEYNWIEKFDVSDIQGDQIKTPGFKKIIRSERKKIFRLRQELRGAKITPCFKKNYMCGKKVAACGFRTLVPKVTAPFWHLYEIIKLLYKKTPFSKFF